MSLAYLAAQTYGLAEEAAQILSQAGLSSGPAILQGAKLVIPPKPLVSDASNWPFKNGRKNIADHHHTRVNAVNAVQAVSEPAPRAEAEKTPAQDSWGADDLDIENLDIDSQPAVVNGAHEADDMDIGEGWGVDDDLDIISEPQSPVQKSGPQEITRGINPVAAWIRSSVVPAEHIAAGAFESAIQILQRQYNIVNFEPLKPLFMEIYQAANVFVTGEEPGEPLLVPIILKSENNKAQPRIELHTQDLHAKLRKIYPLVTGAR